jgi:hypothetical protein
MKKLRRLFLFFMIIIPVFSQTNLSGNISGMTIESVGNPFVVSDNLTIPSGKKLVIKEGCILLFKPFTGIIVEGDLDVEGTLEKPVIFTTENDSVYNSESKQSPNPFDWNGILIGQKAGTVRLSNFDLKYSVYGIKSSKEGFIINNGTFSRNGQFHVAVKDKMEKVVDDIPFNFGIDQGEKPDSAKVSAQGKAMNSSSGKTVTPVAWRKPTAVIAGTMGLAALGASAYYFHQKSIYASNYESATVQSQMDNMVAKQESSLRTAVLFAVAAGILEAGGITLFVWDNRTVHSKTLAFSPVIGNFNGIVVSFEY